MQDMESMAPMVTLGLPKNGKGKTTSIRKGLEKNSQSIKKLTGVSRIYRFCFIAPFFKTMVQDLKMENNSHLKPVCNTHRNRPVTIQAVTYLFFRPAK
ncbi:hypothetical protein KU73_16915 [Pectobacterium wasabiae]|uniref:Uncharacterized protein n=1 Tax=Pectobacterium wasabiae TaxID=55208 RepID=A0AAW3EE07_9GAMM|nr:hypothetical protein A7983_08520 [Pectobacterium wasabiae CFBP 3304]KFX04199.1 hypothetical protein JV38_16925 [Pectobacterium wasabiae]KGA27333.1 hypothetical protein KU73_16915 [Pectobacterium wasabiae]